MYFRSGTACCYSMKHLVEVMIGDTYAALHAHQVWVCNKIRNWQEIRATRKAFPKIKLNEQTDAGL